MRHLFTLSSLALLMTGCVTRGTYDAKVMEFDQYKSDAGAKEKSMLTKIAGLQKDLKSTQKSNSQLEDKLNQMGVQVSQLTNEKGELLEGLNSTQRGLNEAQTRLEELKKQKAAADARLATFRGLLQKLRSMIDSGQLKVVIREGRMQIALPNDVLFDPGKTNLKAEGQEAVKKVAQALATIPDRHFLVAGHTDNKPIKTARFPSNWELSTARAIEVSKLLVENGVKPELLAASGHAEFDPLVPNDTPEQRAQNRRIEIILQPNISDLPSMDSLSSDIKSPAAPK